MNRKRLWLMLGVALASGIAPVWAELKVEQVQKLLADDGWRGRFGRSVSLDGDTAVIGAYWHESAYVFTRVDGVWAQQARLVADDGVEGDVFGLPVSLDGDTAVIGAQGDDTYGFRSGAAYVFVQQDGVWAQQAKLVADDGAEGDEFGQSVSLDGDTVVIGAASSAAGSAYVFTRTNGLWEQQAKVLADDGAAGDRFGGSVSLDGDTAMVGAWGDDDNGIFSGSAYVFTRTNGLWEQQAKLLADDGVEIAYFGNRVSVDGDTAVIGAPGDDDNGFVSGSAYVFTRTDGVWARQAKLLADDGAELDLFGDSVSLEGDTAVIGAPKDDDNGPDSGSAFVFTRTDGVWAQQAKLLADDGAEKHQFGVSVSLDGDTAVIGAWWDGSAYVFRIIFDPVDLLNALIDQVGSLGLHHGTENSLIAKLDAALMILTDASEDNDHAAVNVLGAFINQVEAQHGKRIAAADADDLIEAAEEIIGLLEEAE